jgi:ribonucleoside-triphosphate reductase
VCLSPQTLRRITLNDYSNFIALSRYARWIEEEGRRETWSETVARYVNFWEDTITNKEADWLYDAIYNLDVVPSMRAIMTAGPALERDHVAGYNCAYVAIDNPKVFDEIMYVLLCGTGVGFSCERKEVKKLPSVAEELTETDTTIVVADSKIGWAKAYRQLIALLYAGEIPKFDTSKVRPAGAKLRTFGGRASGPAPLVELFNFTIDTFKRAAGRKLTDLECHDLVCKVAEIVVVGGVRRSALISLSSPESDRMQSAKSGAWWNGHGQRALANNSACYDKKPDFSFYMNEMKALYESYSGERGIFSREAARKIAGRNGRRDTDYNFGCNPCSTRWR